MKEIIMERLECNERQAEIIEQDLKDLSPDLKPALDCWLEDGTCMGDTSYGGYSISSLMSGYGMSFPAALLTLDWIIKEPEKALKALSEPAR